MMKKKFVVAGDITGGPQYNTYAVTPATFMSKE
jgi:hypothetical protein